MVTKSSFGKTAKGWDATLFTIKNEKATVSVSDFGATLVDFIVPDKNGVMTDINLGYDNAYIYDTDRSTYFGGTVGRFANRIKGGKFTLNGKEYTLARNNNGKNCLHGGIDGFNFYMYDVEVGENYVAFSRISPDGEEGFPGNLKFTVKYTLEDTALSIEYFAESDADTVIGFTNHSYFNLNGSTSGKDVLNHTLFVNADAYGVVDDDALFTGLIRPVENTVFDFRKPALLRDRLLSGDPDIKHSNDGVDNFFPCRAALGEMYLNSSVHCIDNGITLDCYTDQIGVQVYTAAFVDTTGKRGTYHGKYAGICLETGNYADAPNIPYVHSPILRAGDKHYTKTVYVASVK